MGIPWYFYTIYKKYNIENDLVIDEKSISTSNIDYLYLDYRIDNYYTLVLVVDYPQNYF